jgi:crossover junction endodeoxyribonuclease RuvC
MLTLGIDPGLAITGYGLVRQVSDRLELVAAGVILTPKAEPLPRRLQTIYHELSGLVAAWRPDAGAVEQLFFNVNVRTAMPVGHARGVVLLALVEAGVPVFEYAPLQVKGSLCGYGRADKGQMQRMVQLLLSLDAPPQPDDAADAVAVALCHIYSSRLQALVDAIETTP